MIPNEYLAVRIQTETLQYRGFGSDAPAFKIDKTPRKQAVNSAESMAAAAQAAADMIDTAETTPGPRFGRRHLLEMTDHVGRKQKFQVTCVKLVATYEAMEVA